MYTNIENDLIELIIRSAIKLEYVLYNDNNIVCGNYNYDLDITRNYLFISNDEQNIILDDVLNDIKDEDVAYRYILSGESLREFTNQLLCSRRIHKHVNNLNLYEFVKKEEFTKEEKAKLSLKYLQRLVNSDKVASSILKSIGSSIDIDDFYNDMKWNRSLPDLISQFREDRKNGIA